jgi:2-polyprenyl-6-methoxyphenol hydroxylase-like FAD-dependent oxidoreductase
MAITGADRLAALIDDLPDLPTALTAWEAELRPHTEQHQRAARRNAAHFTPTSWPQVWLGQIPIRLAGLPAAAALLRRRSAASGYTRDNRQG